MTNKTRPFLPVFRVILAVSVLATLSPVVAQEVEDTITTTTSLIQLNVGVVDRQGRAITSLSQNDFVVYEDGVKQTIQRFEPAEAPFSLVLLLDMSGSTINFRQQLKLASIRFLDALGPQDRVAVIQFNAKVKSLTDFTLDRQKTAYAIDTLAQGSGETNLFEALRYSIQQLEKEGRRRKAIVVLTDGLDSQLRKVDRQTVAAAQTDQEALATIKPQVSSELNTVLASADRQGVSIYPLALPSGDPKRLPMPTPSIIGIYASARQRMQALADRTGGRLHEVHRLEKMAELYREVAANLRTLYTVAYQPSGERARGKWHEIRIEVPNTGLIARTKSGYFAR
jgi:VWFA-related protein